MDEGLLRPCTTQITEGIPSCDAEDPFVDEPGGGTEGRRLPSSRFPVSRQAFLEPVLYPGVAADRELVLPSPVVPGVELHFMAFRQDLTDKVGKERAVIGEGRTVPYKAVFHP